MVVLYQRQHTVHIIFFIVKNIQLVVPINWRKGMLSTSHYSIFRSHQGTVKTLSHIQVQVFWPGISNYLNNYYFLSRVSNNGPARLGETVAYSAKIQTKQAFWKSGNWYCGAIKCTVIEGLPLHPYWCLYKIGGSSSFRLSYSWGSYRRSDVHFLQVGTSWDYSIRLWISICLTDYEIIYSSDVDRPNIQYNHSYKHTILDQMVF